MPADRPSCQGMYIGEGTSNLASFMKMWFALTPNRYIQSGAPTVWVMSSSCLRCPICLQVLYLNALFPASMSDSFFPMYWYSTFAVWCLLLFGQLVFRVWGYFVEALKFLHISMYYIEHLSNSSELCCQIIVIYLDSVSGCRSLDIFTYIFTYDRSFRKFLFTCEHLDALSYIDDTSV